jgi:hypothetical protein
MNVTEEIEALIDKHGLLHVLTAIECVCGEKAEHIRTNWQDHITAKPWEAASKIAGVAARKIQPLEV